MKTISYINKGAIKLYHGGWRCTREENIAVPSTSNPKRNERMTMRSNPIMVLEVIVISENTKFRKGRERSGELKGVKERRGFKMNWKIKFGSPLGAWWGILKTRSSNCVENIFWCFILRWDPGHLDSLIRIDGGVDQCPVESSLFFVMGVVNWDDADGNHRTWIRKPKTLKLDSGLFINNNSKADVDKFRVANPNALNHYKSHYPFQDSLERSLDHSYF